MKLHLSQAWSAIAVGRGICKAWRSLESALLSAAAGSDTTASVAMCFSHADFTVIAGDLAKPTRPSAETAGRHIAGTQFHIKTSA